MHTKLTIQYNDWAAEALTSWLFDRGCSGLEEQKDKVCAWFPQEIPMDDLRALLDGYMEGLAEMHPDQVLSWNHKLELKQDEDWNLEWKKHWNPLPVGKKLMICPTWLDVPKEHSERILIRLDPGAAFGTGTHETTGLLLEWLEELPLAEANVLDAGCGTGVLGIAALKLGAKFCWGIDIEKESILAARENADLNDCRVQCFFKQDNPRMMNTQFRFELILANIQRTVIEEFFSDLVQVLAPGGRILVSGILATEEQAMVVLAAENDCTVDAIHRRGEWLALCYSSNTTVES